MESLDGLEGYQGDRGEDGSGRCHAGSSTVRTERLRLTPAERGGWPISRATLSCSSMTLAGLWDLLAWKPSTGDEKLGRYQFGPSSMSAIGNHRCKALVS